ARAQSGRHAFHGPVEGEAAMRAPHTRGSFLVPRSLASNGEVRGPSATKNPPLNAALVAAVQALGLPVGPGEACTKRVDVSVVRGKSTTLRVRGHLAGGTLDGDTLRLRCVAP